MISTAGEFGARIRARRKQLGWTQAELAARAGTGERFVLELEAGKPSCQLEKSLLIARTLGLEIEDLSAHHQPAAAPPAPEDDGLSFLPRFGVDGR